MISFVDESLIPSAWFLASWSIRWGLLIAAVWVWLRCRPPARAATRHLVIMATLAAGLIVPFAPGWTAWRTVKPAPRTVALLPSEVSNPPAEPDDVIDPLPPAQIELPPTVATVRPPGGPVWFESLGVPRWGWLALGAVWLLGTILGLARLGAGWWCLARLRATAQPLAEPDQAIFEHVRITAARGRLVQAATHSGVGSPVVLGGWSPLILLPPDWASWPESTRRACLLHELAHVHRRDDWYQLAVEVVRAPFWFHPGVAWLASRLDREAELAADEAAVSLGVTPADLARTLLEFARQPHRLTPGPFPLRRQALSFFTRDTVATRINRLMEDDMTRPLPYSSRPRRAALAVTILALALALGGAQVGAIEPAHPAAPLPPILAVTAQEPTPAPITITVKDAEGHPIEGVTVLLRQRLGERSNEFKTIATARSDATGSVRFDHQAQPLDRLIAFKEGYCYVDSRLIEPDGKRITSLTLPPPRFLAGVVSDEQGQPVAAADVRITMTGRRTGNRIDSGNINLSIIGTPLEPIPFTRTDADGRFLFTMLPDNPEMTLLLTAPLKGRIDAHAQSRPGLPGNDLPTLTQITLTREARISGQIVSKVPGLSVAGHRVILQAIDARGGPIPSGQDLDMATSDDEGRFEFAGIAGAEAGVCLSIGDANAPWIHRPALHIPLKPGQTSAATIELIPGVIVTGTMIGRDQQPLAGVKMDGHFGGRFRSRFVAAESTTDAAGTYRFRLPPGPATIGLRWFVAPYTVPDGESLTRDVTVPEGVPTLTLPPMVLIPTAKLVGDVVDAAGEPVIRAKVIARVDRFPMFFNDVFTTTDGTGHFELEKLSDGAAIPPGSLPPIEVLLEDGRKVNATLAAQPGSSRVLVKLPILRDGVSQDAK